MYSISYNIHFIYLIYSIHSCYIAPFLFLVRSLFMRFRAVIFDVGGVLIRTDDHSSRHAWELRLGMKRGELAKAVFESEACALAVRGQATAAQVWRTVTAPFGLSDTQLRTLRHDFWACERIDGTLVQFLGSLRPRFRTALLSNAWPGARAVLTQSRRCRLSDETDLLVISAEEGIAKPDPRIFQLCAERLSVELHEAVFVDDMVLNVEAAQAVGMHALQFHNTSQIITALRQVLELPDERERGS